MKITYQSKEKFTMKELYDLTQSPAIDKMSNHKDETVSIGSYLIYEKGDTENPQTVAVIQTNEGETFASNSPTFITAFRDILDMAAVAGEDIHEIKVVGGTSRGGRNYITCQLIS